MKKVLLLFSAILFFACSNNDPEPDLTSEIVGVYRYSKNDLESKEETVWTITKESNVKVEILITQKILTDLHDDTFISKVSNVLMADYKTMNFKGSLVDGASAPDLSGKGVLSGKQLVVTVARENDGAFYELTKD